MCTAINLSLGDNYFGRNLDLDTDYNAGIIITPRDYEIRFSGGDVASRHYAIIGMGIEADNYPLYFDGVNEKGLSCAALQFDSEYAAGVGSEYVASYEFILWVLALNQSVSAVRERLKKIEISSTPFSESFKSEGLHFIIADRFCSITVEQTEAGLKVYDNPFGVLTNNPSFPTQLMNLNNFSHLSSAPQVNRFSMKIKAKAYSNGLGAFSLPGDFSSTSRFVRAVFIKENSVCEGTENECLAHFFSMLCAVAVPSGSVINEKGRVHKTIYSSCSNTDKGVYYYKRYDEMVLHFSALSDYDIEGKDVIKA